MSTVMTGDLSETIESLRNKNEKRLSVITRMVCRYLHLKLLFSGLLQNDLFKGR